MAHTGARPSEILGLNAEDIDVAAGVVRIEKTRAFVGPPVERTTKTRKSRRAIAAPRAVLETVLAQAEPAGPLFTTSRGTVVRGPQVSYEFRRAAESVGLSLRLYDLRHFHATQLLAAGIPLHEVSWRLGHGSVSITADIYAHWVPARDQEASSAIGRILGDGA
jgi:integrase